MTETDNKTTNALPDKISTVLLLTSRCMLDCSHCYNYTKEPDLNLEQHIKILENLYKIGVYRIVFSGGECLLVKHIAALLKNSMEHGVFNSVSTNGLLLTKTKFAEIQPYIGQMDISLNSLRPDTNKKMIKNYFSGYETKILNRIDMVSSSEIPLNINILLSKTNENDIIDVLTLLKQKNINAVKLFEHSAIRGRAKDIHDTISINGDDFHIKCDELIKQFPTIHFMKRTTKRLVESYLRISHSGDFEMYKNRGGSIGNPIKGSEITRKDIENALNINNKQM